MPFFKRNNKPPKRRLDAGNTTLSKSNLSLAGTGELAESVNNALVKLKLGRHELSFQDGEWIAEPGSQSSSRDGAEVNRLQKQNAQLKEENNYLKYKIEVLLDMMAASTADCNVMEKELDTLQSQKQGRRVAR
ncbi:Protein chibby 1 [Desmophyllum pertusum]|uniref:Protein chibby 1 n=1 Tax=Desmophyllum pertusum TaxID=174260 RepID=A0A9W9ZZP4_9CNID|nr:Protein chibby 1 [Desmophyllum pertusum]